MTLKLAQYPRPQDTGEIIVTKVILSTRIYFSVYLDYRKQFTGIDLKNGYSFSTFNKSNKCIMFVDGVVGIQTRSHMKLTGSRRSKSTASRITIYWEDHGVSQLKAENRIK